MVSRGNHMGISDPFQLRLGDDLSEAVENYTEEQNIENDSEAMRQLLRRGLSDWREDGNGVIKLTITQLGALTAYLGAVIALLYAMAGGWPANLVTTAGLLAVAAIVLTLANAIDSARSGLFEQFGIKWG